MINQPNMQIRKTCKQLGIPLWLLAQHMNISETTLIRWLRVEYSDTEKNNMIKLIHDISERYKEAT